MGREFKVGDRVVCVSVVNILGSELMEVDILEDKITMGDIYTIIAINDREKFPLSIKNDYGWRESYGYNNFESLNVYRVNIINNILYEKG